MATNPYAEGAAVDMIDYETEIRAGATRSGFYTIYNINCKNIGEYNYPNLLLTSGMNDPLVQYWEPIKFLSRIRKFCDFEENNKVA